MRDIAIGLLRVAKGITIDWPKEFSRWDDPAQVFVDRWFMSKKPKNAKLYAQLAEAYPYSGYAYRLDQFVPFVGKYASWSMTMDGLNKFRTMPGMGGSNGLYVYKAKITHGIDLAMMVKEEGLASDSFGGLIVWRRSFRLWK